MTSQGVPGDGADRDRDDAGRPRNARPRDSSGRPLPRGSVGEPRVPDDLVLAPDQALDLAQRFLDESRPFQAHEVLEACWKSAPAGERDLWQGLAQIAVGLTHAQRGNATGAAALLRRGADRMRGYLPGGGSRTAGASTHGIDVAGIVLAADTLAAGAERDGVAGLSSAGLRLRTATGSR